MLQIVLGSASDLGIVRESGIKDMLKAVLGEHNYQVSICSAHRNARELDGFADGVCRSGAEVFIGIAGMATALPGALAGLTGMTKLVIGVPLDEDGIDSCLYMPPGVPVATAGVGKTGIKQAALMACQVLAIKDARIMEALRDHLQRTAKQPQFDIDL